MVDVETDEVFIVTDDFKNKVSKVLSNYDVVICHNGVRFDFNILRDIGIKLPKIEDTLIMSKLIIPQSKLRDRDSIRKNMPKELIGSYSLRAFGYRLGNYKQNFTDFTKLTDEMIEYCVQDCKVTKDLYLTLMKSKLMPNYPIRLKEYRVGYLMYMQEVYGFPFDIRGAVKLANKLEKEQLEIKTNLQKLFPPRLVKDKDVENPALKDYTKSKGYKVVGPYTKLKVEEFNPSSRQQIVSRLKDVWKPEVFTSKGTPVVDDTTLPDIEISKDLIRYLKIVKDLGQLKVGTNSWINLYNRKTKRIHGKVDSLGANTHRMTHRNPNMTQLVKDKEFRSLFTTNKNNLIGIDADALELMMLGYYLDKHNNHKFIRSVSQGSKEKGDDIHTLNQKIMKLSSRNQAKTAIYGICYGIGGIKLGRNIWEHEKFDMTIDEQNEAINQINKKLIGNYYQLSENLFIPYSDDLIYMYVYGQRTKNNLIHNLVGYKDLLANLSKEVRKNSSIELLDGRRILCEDAHKSLNYLLQGGGAIFMKDYLLDTYESMYKLNIILGKHYRYICNIHDALVLEILDDSCIDQVCEILRTSFTNVSNKYDFSYPIKGEPCIGNNLYDIFI